MALTVDRGASLVDSGTAPWVPRECHFREPRPWAEAPRGAYHRTSGAPVRPTRGPRTRPVVWEAGRSCSGRDRRASPGLCAWQRQKQSSWIPWGLLQLASTRAPGVAAARSRASPSCTCFLLKPWRRPVWPPLRSPPGHRGTDLMDALLRSSHLAVSGLYRGPPLIVEMERLPGLFCCADF